MVAKRLTDEKIPARTIVALRAAGFEVPSNKKTAPLNIAEAVMVVLHL